MEHQPSTPDRTPDAETETGYERLPAPMSGVFNFDMLEPDEAAELVTVLYEAHRVADEQANSGVSKRPGYGGRNFTYAFEADLGAYCSGNPERGLQFFDALRSRADSMIARGACASTLAPVLVKHYAHEYAKRKPIIDAWLGLLNDDDSTVRETTAQTMSEAVDSDWIDEPTARYIDAMLPADWQREDWWTDEAPTGPS